MIIVTILSLTISIVLLIQYISDYVSVRSLSKSLGWNDIKIIKLEDVVENGSIKKLSTKNDFLILITKGTKYWKKIDVENISNLQSDLLLNRYFISYSNLVSILEIMRKDNIIRFSNKIKE